MFRAKKGKILMVTAALLCGLSACSIEETNGTKVSDLEYVIVKEADVPAELAAIIEEKKAADFKISYELENDLYIVRGYGEQETGGYSISIKELYLTSNAVLFDTELTGPRKGETTSRSPSYPYIVVKIEKQDKNIVFD